MLLYFIWYLWGEIQMSKPEYKQERLTELLEDITFITENGGIDTDRYRLCDLINEAKNLARGLENGEEYKRLSELKKEVGGCL